MPRPLETVATQVVANEAESIANEGESVEVPVNTNPNMAVKTSSKKSNKCLPASIRDELRRTLAIKCYDTVNSMSSMKVSEQHKMMFKL